jgi:uncharacterized protein
MEAMSVSSLHIISKSVGPICNLHCKYCFYLEKENLYPQLSKWAMRKEVLESYIRQYIEGHEGEDVSFAWQGGEPSLLGVDYFRLVRACRGDMPTETGSRMHLKITASS